MSNYYCKECGIRINSHQLNQSCPACGSNDFVKKEEKSQTFKKNQFDADTGKNETPEKKKNTVKLKHSIPDPESDYKDMKVQFECHDCSHIFTSHVKESMCPKCKSAYILKTEELFGETIENKPKSVLRNNLPVLVFSAIFFIVFFFYFIGIWSLFFGIIFISIFLLFKKERIKKNNAPIMKKGHDLLVIRDHAVIWSAPDIKREKQADIVNKGFRINAMDVKKYYKKSWFRVDYNGETHYILSDDVIDLKKTLMGFHWDKELYIAVEKPVIHIYEKPSILSRTIKKIKRGQVIYNLGYYERYEYPDPKIKKLKNDNIELYCTHKNNTWIKVYKGYKFIGYANVNDFYKFAPWIVS